MVRVLIGSVVGGIAQWIVGFLFWGTPLSRIAFAVAPEAANAALQTALAQTLTPTGSGTYHIPWPDSAQGTILHGRGPVALVMFNTNGFPLSEPSSLIVGLLLSIVTILLFGVALFGIAGRVADFGSRMRIVVLASVATTLMFTVGQPVFNAYLPWGYWIYLALSQFVGLIVGGLILVRWFMPGAEVRPAVDPNVP